jgi:hypothetical protein
MLNSKEAANNCKVYKEKSSLPIFSSEQHRYFEHHDKSSEEKGQQKICYSDC